MSKKLLVRTPQTKDGVNLLYNDEKQVVYKESIVELAAEKGLKSLNATLPTHLRHEFKVIEVDEATAQSSSNEELKKKLAALEEENETEKLKQRIAELEAERDSKTKPAAPDNTTEVKANDQLNGPASQETEEKPKVKTK
jgi:hypothetical protein